MRTAKHNALIDAIRIAGRYIFRRFAKMPSADLQRIEDELAEKGQSLLNVERVDFSRGMILPDGISLKDRKAVAAWAERLNAELEKEDILAEAEGAREKSKRKTG